jgi:hypothetical protein
MTFNQIKTIKYQILAKFDHIYSDIVTFFIKLTLIRHYHYLLFSLFFYRYCEALEL